MGKIQKRHAIILFADIVGCSEISNENGVEDYAKILYQFFTAADLAYQATDNFKIFKKEGEEFFFNFAGDEVCLFILLKEDTESLSTPDCDDKLYAALRFSVSLKFFWYLSEYNLIRTKNQLAPREIGIGIHVGPIAYQKNPPRLMECEKKQFHRGIQYQSSQKDRIFFPRSEIYENLRKQRMQCTD